jgi:4'-phosphopantetheinyl transferase
VLAVDVWRIALDQVRVPPPTQGETARAARFRTPELAARYLKAHGALRDILGRYTAMPLEFALREMGKPYLPLSPEVCFNLSHSHEMALVAVALRGEVGVDVEKLRPMDRYADIAGRYFPPSEPAPGDEVEFFKRWTRVEAVLKARGVGLYGAAMEIEGDWSIEEIDAGPGFAAAVAAQGNGITLKLHDYGEDS